ncbi:MAG: KilA-N domain-containing protein [Cetobacterium sp.]
MNLIVKEYLGNKIEFKMINGTVYANANGMATGFGGSSKIADWKRSSNTQRYIGAMENSHRVVGDFVISKDGKEAGTWIHEKLVLHFARYCNVDFEIWCDEQIATLIRDGKVEIQKQFKKLEEKIPMEVLSDNGKALNDLFSTLGLNIPKELIVSTAINTTQRMTGYDFSEVKLLLNKQDEEAYHTKSDICKRVGIKANKVNLSLIELGIQIEGSTTMQPFVLTELGKHYAVERSFTNGRHQGYEIKLKDSAEDYIRENLDKLPTSWVK